MRGFSFLLFKTRTEFLSESHISPDQENVLKIWCSGYLVLCSKSLQTECFHIRVINYFSGSHDLSLRLGPGTWDPLLRRLTWTNVSLRSKIQRNYGGFGEGKATNSVFWPREVHGLYIVHGVAKSQTRLSKFCFHGGLVTKLCPTLVTLWTV